MSIKNGPVNHIALKDFICAVQKHKKFAWRLMFLTATIALIIYSVPFSFQQINLHRTAVLMHKEKTIKAERTERLYRDYTAEPSVKYLYNFQITPRYMGDYLNEHIENIRMLEDIMNSNFSISNNRPGWKMQENSFTRYNKTATQNLFFINSSVEPPEINPWRIYNILATGHLFNTADEKKIRSILGTLLEQVYLQKIMDRKLVSLLAEIQNIRTRRFIEGQLGRTVNFSEMDANIAWSLDFTSWLKNNRLRVFASLEELAADEKVKKNPLILYFFQYQYSLLELISPFDIEYKGEYTPPAVSATKPLFPVGFFFKKCLFFLGCSFFIAIFTSGLVSVALEYLPVLIKNYFKDTP
ncbi:MAG: hypothetical protein A2096_13960 [Spirochaetes bacterium GWF1_41_5]|nr:MAG: hypothetical protein A2096_13960 [Spirochaetes bacterium GWF1_41_5]